MFINESGISPFSTVLGFIEKLKKNVLAGAHRKLERARPTKTYLLGLKVPYKPKFKFPFDIVTKHVFLYLKRPN